MEVLQGRYVSGVESSKGQLKSVQIDTDSGMQTVHLPKSLREIAQQELTLGEPVRIWALADKKPKQKLKKELRALQIVPLQPKPIVSIPLAQPSIKPASPQLTVQLCQRKNCCKRGGDQLWQAFEKAAYESSRDRPFKLESVGCLGGCKHGPNIRIMPANVKQRQVAPGDIEGILQRYSE